MKQIKFYGKTKEESSEKMDQFMFGKEHEEFFKKYQLIRFDKYYEYESEDIPAYMRCVSILEYREQPKVA